MSKSTPLNPQDEFVFLPLGGSGEIGMNLNLYGYGPEDDRRWIIVDIGVTFGDDRTPVQLARAFQVTKGAITNTLQRLEARGLVRVVPDPQDGRSKRVRLTAAGRRMREACVAATVPILALLDGEATLKEVADTLVVLRRIRARLDRARDPIP